MIDIELIIDEHELDQIAGEYTQRVREKAEDTLEKVEDEMQYCDTMTDVANRMWKSWGYDGLHVVERCFSCMHQNYRLVFIKPRGVDYLVFWTVVSKSGDEQKKELSFIRQNTAVVDEYAKDVILRYSG